MARSLPFELGVRFSAIGCDSVDHFGHFVVLGHHRKKRSPAAIGCWRRTIAEKQPRKERRQSIPFLKHLAVICPRVRSNVNAVERIDGEISDDIIQHHPTSLAHLDILRPGRQKQHRDQILADVVGRIILALTYGCRDSHPIEQPFPRFLRNFVRTLAIEPAIARLIRPELRHQVERHVIHHPVILGVSAQRHVRSPGFTDRTLGSRRQLIAPQIRNAGNRKHPKHVSARALHELDHAFGTKRGVLATRQLCRDVRQPYARRITWLGESGPPVHDLVSTFQIHRPPDGRILHHERHWRRPRKRRLRPALNRQQRTEGPKQHSKSFHGQIRRYGVHLRGTKTRSNTIACSKNNFRQVRPKSSDTCTAS